MGDVAEHPAAQRMRLRAKLERVVDKLLAAMDVIDGDADLEPSLGLSEPGSLYVGNGLDQRDIAQGATDDREGEHDGREPSEDLEESLGRSETFDQRRTEYGQPDLEPSLGSVGALSAGFDQRDWAMGGDKSDRELECEDEGAETGDAECDLGWTAHESAGTPHAWSFPTDREHDLGASEAADQRAWAHPQPALYRQNALEDQSDD